MSMCRYSHTSLQRYRDLRKPKVENNGETILKGKASLKKRPKEGHPKE